MIFVLSGEGPSDLGSCDNGALFCVKPEYQHGPLTAVIDDLVEEVFRYRPLEVAPNSYRFYSETALSVRAKDRRNNRPLALAGKKNGQETGYFRINARMLAEIAMEAERRENDKSIAILFRDTDGGNNAPRALWQTKVQSMINGFAEADYDFGIPMVPRPKSEAWLLCAAKENPYQGCAVLEDLPGNDDSPNAAKRQLREALDGRSDTGDLLAWLKENRFDHAAVAAQMPSFDAFRRRFLEVLENLRG
ncbi:hypothetical protein [Burkholderia gladioli]|uniref:hypothetical protein n=1 Tax=Burkholderia gladioli TaxID=28095 RepID=UPI00163E5EB7|nr:hypothetical protein [Burkholderia gladioli]